MSIAKTAISSSASFLGTFSAGEGYCALNFNIAQTKATSESELSPKVTEGECVHDEI